ncbi:hypothetical protein V7127_24085 [Bacillus sp. JJ1773]|uniref:hypothetical protein n=1 Tax=Bacillus sp. JJ1773 TaxID=3122965 RepID=UPI002FFDE4E8
MSRFVERFETHPIHLTLENNINTTFQIIENEQQGEAIIELDRINQVLQLIKDILKNCDPNLVHISYLDNLQNNCLTTTLSQLNSYRNQSNIGFLNAANNHLDGYIPSITNIISPNLPNDVEGIRESISSFRRSVSQHLRYTEEDYKKLVLAKTVLEEGFNQVASTVETQKGRLDTAISDFQQQFSNAEELRRTKFSEIEDKRENDFKELEKEWEEIFKDTFENVESALGQKLIEFQNKENDLEEEFTTRSEQYLETLEEYKNKAAKVLNIISNTSMAGGYKQVADQEQSSRKFWRFITMSAMILLIFAALYSFISPIGDNSIWTEIAKRLSVAAALAAVVGYASRQAKIHLDAERLYRRMELELTSLSPYLVELGDDERKEIMAKMAEKFFGMANVENIKSEASEQSSSENKNDILKILEDILSLAKK